MAHHDHAHAHHHAHTHLPVGGDPRRALSIALVLNGGFLVVEAVAGWWTGSLALLSDAAHMTSDVGALAMALGAAQLARRKPDARMTFGLHRAETLGAFLNALALLAAVVWIVVEALSRLTEGAPDVVGWPILIVGLVGLAINVGSAWALWRSDRGNLNVRGAMAHMIADALGSVGAVVAAGFVMAGFAAADAWISIGIAALVALSAVRLLRDAGRVLLQLPPSAFDVDGLLAHLVRLEGVQGVHDLHVWSLDGQAPIVTAHLVVDTDDRALALAHEASQLAHERFGVDHATFQVEREPASPCATLDCGANARAAS